MSAADRGRTFPIDFDRNGHVRATRTFEDPAPLAWAYGLPFVFVARGGIPLLGRAHAQKVGKFSVLSI